LYKPNNKHSLYNPSSVSVEIEDENECKIWLEKTEEEIK
jgi:hypothetical protein